LKKFLSFGNGFRRSIAAVLAVVVLVCAMSVTLSGCSSADKLYILAYGDYFDTDILDSFESEYGIRVIYDSYAAPEDLYAKLVSGATQYDLICAADYIIEKLIGNDQLSPLNFDNIPNYANIGEQYVELTRKYDATGTFSVPHFWGTIGILYDTTVVPEEDVSTWNVLFDEKYSGEVIMPNSERDAMFVALRLLGYPLNTTDKAQLDEAADMLANQKNIVQAYLLDEAARNKVESGNAAMAVIYNGEAYLAMENNENLDFIIPDEGTYVWMDSWAVPAGTEKQLQAETFINYLCDAEIAQQNFEYIYYSTPNAAVIENLEQDILDIKAIFPDEEIFDTCEVLNYLGTEIEEYYSYLWRMIKS